MSKWLCLLSELRAIINNYCFYRPPQGRGYHLEQEDGVLRKALFYFNPNASPCHLSSASTQSPSLLSAASPSQPADTAPYRGAAAYDHLSNAFAHGVFTPLLIMAGKANTGIVRKKQWCEMVPCLEDEGCDLLVNKSGWTCTQPGGRVKTTTVKPEIAAAPISPQDDCRVRVHSPVSMPDLSVRQPKTICQQHPTTTTTTTDITTTPPDPWSSEGRKHHEQLQSLMEAARNSGLITQPQKEIKTHVKSGSCSLIGCLKKRRKGGPRSNRADALGRVISELGSLTATAPSSLFFRLATWTQTEDLWVRTRHTGIAGQEEAER
ncbi:Protein FAM19A5 [Liparis tanakae]|uniref:Protein FAM19A5 n=1 Tax=Liparis tanakae TaxID=230148 RepID=A0A4Z2HX42_9TELE|nr:Protein FAM19A5 [Liparis tanakae]